MNKYKLINKQTGEEFICEKVTIGRFDYYVNDKNPFPYATNNPNIDIAKVVDDLDFLAKAMFPLPLKLKRRGYPRHKPKNPPKGLNNWIKSFKAGYNKCQETYSFSEEDMIKFAEFVAKYPNKNKNYKEEMLHAKSKYDGAERTIDLLQLWKGSHPKIVYYA